MADDQVVLLDITNKRWTTALARWPTYCSMALMSLDLQGHKHVAPLHVVKAALKRNGFRESFEMDDYDNMLAVLETDPCAIGPFTMLMIQRESKTVNERPIYTNHMLVLFQSAVDAVAFRLQLS